MAIRTPSEIDFSTFPTGDGQPMAETFANTLQMVDLEWALQALFDQQGRIGTTTVGGNQFVYYNPANGRDNISPDVYVAFDVPPPAPPKWQTWVQGKFPDIVFEITSSSTHGEDIGRKRGLYARLGAREYYIFDPQQETTPSFLGFASRDGRMEPLPHVSSGGVLSPLLGAELRPMSMGATERRPSGVWLRVIDPLAGTPIAVFEEERAILRAARASVEARLAEEARARVAVEARLAAVEEERDALLAAVEEERDALLGPAPQ